MRPTVWLSLVALCLIAAGLRNHATAEPPQTIPPKPPRAGARPPAGRPGDQLPSWAVESSWEKTRDLALQDALEKAQVKVTEYLRQPPRPLEWTPTKEYVRDKLLRDLGKDETFSDPDGGKVSEERLTGRRVLVVAKDFSKRPGEEPGEMYRVHVRIEVRPEDRQEMVRQEQEFQGQVRQLRALDRQTLLAKILGGFVALLAVVSVYLRIEDATKGYYTTLLRLAAGAFVALVAAGLFLLR
jgi:hypothetical protein